MKETIKHLGAKKKVHICLSCFIIYTEHEEKSAGKKFKTFQCSAGNLVATLRFEIIDIKHKWLSNLHNFQILYLKIDCCTNCNMFIVVFVVILRQRKFIFIARFCGTTI